MKTGLRESEIFQLAFWFYKTYFLFKTVCSECPDLLYVSYSYSSTGDCETVFSRNIFSFQFPISRPNEIEFYDFTKADLN